MTTFLNRPTLDQWPDLAPVPPGLRTTVSAAIARRLFRAGINRFPVTVHLEGRTLGTGGPEMTIRRPDEFFDRLGRGLLIGFGEAYLTGAWDADDLGGFLTVLAADMPTLVPPALQKLRALAVRRPPSHEKSTRANSQRNIAHHYDLSNDLFELFLDPGLSYSSGLFATEPVRVGDHTLMAAPEPGGDLRAGPGPQDRAAPRPHRASARAPECSRSAPAGASWRSTPRAAARPCTRSRCRRSRRRWPSAGSPRPGSSDRVTVELLDYRERSRAARRTWTPTTPCCRWR